MADRRLQVFHAVARQLSFTKAAEVLLMTQPAVTFQIKQLEEHFNTRLFDRGHGRISLTPAGELVLKYADQILGLSSEMDVRLGEMTGEMGCYDEQTEVLTEQGWKFFKDLKHTDKICTLNPGTHKIQYNNPTSIVIYNHHKQLLFIQNQTLDIAVTLDHNMYACSQQSARSKKY